MNEFRNVLQGMLRKVFRVLCAAPLILLSLVVVTVLSEETGVKIVRKGFTLLPDFASTAFMMQGYTLDGAVADCGSVLASGGLTEMMTTYVILSRVKKADGLLLTQAFARGIFRLGVAPGPHCLLKLLHQRFSSGMSLDEAYGPEQAAAEYHERVASLHMKLTRRKQRGAGYLCFDCNRDRTPERFGADGKRESEVMEKCVRPGEWLQCQTCRKACDDAMADGWGAAR